MKRQNRSLPGQLAALFLAVMLLGALTGCAGTPDSSSPSPDPAPAETPTASPEPSEEPSSPASAPPEEDEFSYTAPEGWVKAEQYSTKDKVFYVQAGHEEDDLPDNISVEVKSNRYGLDEHEKFRDAILRQLLMQTQGIQAELTGDGTFTAGGDILYIFTIREEDVTTVQYYVLGEKRYCLIHLTNFTGSEEAAEAARAMADSFTWG